MTDCNSIENPLLELGGQTSNEQDIDIVTFETVSYGKKPPRPIRQLSSESYMCAKTIGQMGIDEFSRKHHKAARGLRKVMPFDDERPKKTIFSRSLGTVVTVCCFVMLAVVVFIVLGNGIRGESSFFTVILTLMFISFGIT